MKCWQISGDTPNVCENYSFANRRLKSKEGVNKLFRLRPVSDYPAMGNRQANKTGRVIRSICGESKPLQRLHHDSENIFFSLKKNDNIKQTHLNITYNTQNKSNIGNLESALSSFFPRYVWSCSQVHYILLLDKKFNFSTIFVITI